MKLPLTDLTVKNLTYQNKQLIYWDEILPAFGLRVSPTTKSFVVIHGKDRKVKTLGRYPDTSLKAARMSAIEFLSKDTSPTPKTAQEALQGFLSDARKRLKPATANQYEQYLNLLDKEKPLADLTKADINHYLAHYDGKPWAQNYAYATLRAFLNWSLDNEYLTTHPLIRGKPPNKTRSRERVLTDDELVRVWRATEDNTYGRMVRVLILTGQRRSEVRNLKPEDVADELITFHTKGDQINVLPLTPLVEENLILPFRFNNWSNSIARLLSEARVENASHHDIRRSFATNMARLGISDIVIERLLGHTINSVKFTYNRYSYLAECKEALLAYEEYIRGIINK